MKVIIVKNHEEMSRQGADIIANQIKSKANSVLGLATGSTPEQTYANLIAMNKEGKISFKDVTTFNLDEYVGLDGDHKKSYRFFMNEQLFNHVDIDKSKTFVPSGIGNIEANAKEFEDKISQLGPIDLQLLGLLIYVLFNRKSKTRLAEYKKEQLALYNKNRRTNVSDYSRTSLYVPFWERVKHSSPIMLTVLFILMGITWIVWTATGTPLIGSL